MNTYQNSKLGARIVITVFLIGLVSTIIKENVIEFCVWIGILAGFVLGRSGLSETITKAFSREPVRKGLSPETLADLQRFVKEGRIGAGMEEEPPKT